MLTTYFPKAMVHVKIVVKIAKSLVYEPKVKFMNHELILIN